MKRMQDRNLKLMKDLNENYKRIEDETQEHFTDFLDKWKKIAKSKLDNYKAAFNSLKDEKEDIQTRLQVIVQDLQDRNKDLVEEYNKLIQKYQGDMESEKKQHKQKVELMESAYDEELSKMKQERIELDALLDGVKTQKDSYESKSKELRNKMKEKEVAKREQLHAMLKNYTEDCAKLVMKGIIDEVEAKDNMVKSETMINSQQKELDILRINMNRLEREKDTLKNQLKRVATANKSPAVRDDKIQTYNKGFTVTNPKIAPDEGIPSGPTIDFKKYDPLVIQRHRQICKINLWKREFEKKEGRKCQKEDCKPIKDMFRELKEINDKLEDCRGVIPEVDNEDNDSIISVDPNEIEDINLSPVKASPVSSAEVEDLKKENKKLNEEIKQLRSTMAGQFDESAVIKDLRKELEKVSIDADKWKTKYNDLATNTNKSTKKEKELNDNNEQLKKENTQLQERLYYFKSRAHTIVGGIPSEEEGKKDETYKKEFEKVFKENQEQLKQIQELEPVKAKLIEVEAKLQDKEKDFSEMREKYQKVGVERLALGKEILDLKQKEAERAKLRSDAANEQAISQEDQKTKDELKLLIKEHEHLTSNYNHLSSERQEHLLKIDKLEKEKEEILDKLANLKRFENDVKELERVKQELLETTTEVNRLRLQMAIGLPEAPEDRNTLIKEDYEKMANENKELKEKYEQIQKKLASFKEVKKNFDEKAQESFVLRQDVKRLQIENDDVARKAEQTAELKAKVQELRMQLADKMPKESSVVRQEMRKVVEENKSLQVKSENIEQVNKNYLQYKSLAENTVAELTKVKQEMKKLELERDGLKIKADKATTYLMERNSARVELAKQSKADEFGMPVVGEAKAMKAELGRLAEENEKLLKNVEVTERVKKENLAKDERIKDLESKYKVSKDKIKDLEVQLSKNIESKKREDLDKVKNEYKELEKLLEKERQMTKSMKTEIDKVTKKYDGLREKEVKELEETIKKLEAQHKQDMASFEKNSSEEMTKKSKQLDEARNEIGKLLEANSGITKDKTDLEGKVKILSQNVQRLEADLTKLKAAEAQAIGLAEKVEQLNAEVAKERADYVIMDKKYKDEMIQRKRLHNIIEDMKGKIRVYCRVRPLSSKEAEMGSQNIVNVMDEFTVKVDTKYGPKSFSFDSSFGPGVSQEKVFEDTKRLVQSAIDGYNVCIFAYGQTGAGKTFTIQGDDKNPGIAPRSFDELQHILQKMNNYSYTLECYMVELYLDTLSDLLLSKEQRRNPPHLEIKEDLKGIMYVHMATRVPIFTSEDAKRIFDLGLNNRKTFATSMNDNSSRSHLIFSIIIETINKQTNQRALGKISFVDLAGSERATKAGTSAERLKEGRAINKSLSALGDVISILSSSCILFSLFLIFNSKGTCSL